MSIVHRAESPGAATAVHQAVAAEPAIDDAELQRWIRVGTSTDQDPDRAVQEALAPRAA